MPLRPIYTPSVSKTPKNTVTPTRSQTPSHTSTANYKINFTTKTPTQTQTPTKTPTNTPSLTTKVVLPQRFVVSLTPSTTQTYTPTNTQTSTNKFILPTNTPTSSKTPTPNNTLTPTRTTTKTPTSTITNTPSKTTTQTPSFYLTPTPTPTVSPNQTLLGGLRNYWSFTESRPELFEDMINGEHFYIQLGYIYNQSGNFVSYTNNIKDNIYTNGLNGECLGNTKYIENDYSQKSELLKNNGNYPNDCTIANSSFKPFDNSFSISLWISFPSTSPEESYFYGSFGGKKITGYDEEGYPSFDYYTQFQFGYENPENDNRFSVGTGGETFILNDLITSDDYSQNNIWNHFVIIVNAEEKKLLLYKNSNLINQYSLVGDFQNSNSDVYRDELTGFIIQLNNIYIDEFTTYNKILNSTDIQTLYNGGSGYFFPYGLTPIQTPTQTQTPTRTPTQTPDYFSSGGYVSSDPLLSPFKLIGAGTSATNVWFLSGDYYKIDDLVINNADVFVNSFGSYYWYLSSQNMWNVTYPDLSGTQYLYARTTKNDYYNPPRTFSGGLQNVYLPYRGSGAADPYRPPFSNENIGQWWNPTQIIPASFMYLSGLQWTRSSLNPYFRINTKTNAGKNSRFYFDQYDFSPLGYTAGGWNSGNWSRVTLISPIHVLWSTHFGVWDGYVGFYRKDGSYVENKVIDGEFAGNVGGLYDTHVGILSTAITGINPFRIPTQNTYSSIIANNPIHLYPNQFTNVSEYVLTQTGSIRPYSSDGSENAINYLANRNLRPSTYLFNAIHFNDSSSPFLLPYNNGELLLTGHTKYTGPEGPRYYGDQAISTINQKMSTLEVKYGYTFGYKVSTV